MTTDQISLLSIVVSLLSALFAAWSLREAKSARAENRSLTISLRKTELITGLIDTTNKGYQLLNAVHECLEEIFALSLIEHKDIQPEVNFLYEKKDEAFEKIKGFDEQKQKFMKIKTFNIDEIEQTLAVAYAQLMAWENDIILANQALQKVKKLASPI